MENTLAMPPPAQTGTSPGKGAATVTPPAAANAEPAAAKAVQAKTPDLLGKFENPAIRKVLEQREAAKAAVTMPPARAAADQSSAGAAPDEKAGSATAKPGEEVKGNEQPDAGVIDFAEPGPGAEPAGDEDVPLRELSEEEAADPAKVKAKLTDAHKDNAKLRKAKREAVEAVKAREQELATLKQELEAAKKSAPAAAGKTGGYLDQFSDPEKVTAAREDALATIKQLQANPDADVIHLPGGREWQLKTKEGESRAPQAAEMALEILDTYEDKLKQLTKRSDAEGLVKEKLPVLSKSIPDFEQRYTKTLGSDWASEAPRLSLNATLGELVTSGDYILVPRKAAKREAEAPAAAEVKTARELPHMTPPARAVDSGPDLSGLKERAMKGDKEALRQWVMQSGKKAD